MGEPMPLDRAPGRGAAATLAFVAIALGAGLLTAATVAAQGPTSFHAHVQPILQTHCVECHRPDGQGFEAIGLDMTSYQGLMRGTRLGPVVIPGDPMTSNLVRVVTGQVAPEIRMPFHRALIPELQATVIRRWVEQGARNN